MDIHQIFLVSMAVAAVLHWALDSILLSVSLPTLGFVGHVLFVVFVKPYEGGGASMWPVALLFVGISAGVGALIGSLMGGALRTLMPSPFALHSSDKDR